MINFWYKNLCLILKIIFQNVTSNYPSYQIRFPMFGSRRQHKKNSQYHLFHLPIYILCINLQAHIYICSNGWMGAVPPLPPQLFLSFDVHIALLSHRKLMLYLAGHFLNNGEICSGNARLNWWIEPVYWRINSPLPLPFWGLDKTAFLTNQLFSYKYEGNFLSPFAPTLPLSKKQC